MVDYCKLVGPALAVLVWLLPAPHAQAQQASGSRKVPLTGAATPDGPTQCAVARLTLGDLARQFNQTALQWDFRSAAQDLAALAKARSELDRAIARLCGPHRDRALRLRQNLDRVLARTTARRRDASDAAALEPATDAPNRDEIALLADEAQALVRDTPMLAGGRRDEELLAAAAKDIAPAQRAQTLVSPMASDARHWSRAEQSDTGQAAGNPFREFSGEPGRVTSYGFNF